jgi:hypothetical protein
MAARTCRVGVHGRNQETFQDIDFQVIRESNAEVVKMMSHTKPEVFDRIKKENPGIEIITRLYDNRINAGGHPTPQEFAQKMIPIMQALKPYCTKFQIHNEPNHLHRVDGWGPEDENAQSFNQWFLQVYSLLKNACPWASLGFPGMAIPTFAHRDRAWLKICRPAIERADWLGVHCYWQTPPNKPSVIFDPHFGLTFKHYHAQYPDKTLEILECGNSNVQSDWHKSWQIPDEDVAQEYVKWLQEVFNYDYINSASFFLLSSQDPTWGFFAWRTENNYKKPVVQRVAQMHRPPLTKPGVAAPRRPPPKPRPRVPTPAPAPGQWTNQHMITAFHDVSVKLGLGNWTLMSRAGIKLADLVRDRQAPFQGPAIDDLPTLTQEQKNLLKQELAAMVAPAEEAVSFGLAEVIGALRGQDDLTAISLTLPSSENVDLAEARTSLERRAATSWNRYSYLLMSIADALRIEPGVAVAVLAAQTDRRGIARNGRLVIRFENHVFYERWGRQNEDKFNQSFRFDPAQPWQKHQWRPSVNAKWRDCHGTQDDEWAVFNFARDLDEKAAMLSTGMGLAEMMGFTYAAADYESVGQMFDAFASSERNQIFAVFDLIAGPSLDSRQLSALRDKDFDTFAALHYGSGQAAKYGSLIRTLYEAFQGFGVL